MRKYSKRILIKAVLLFLTVASAARLSAQQVIQSTPPETRLEWYDQHVAMTGVSHFKNLSWQFIGPTNVSGRMTDIAVATPKGKYYTIYVAGASGGVWKTENEGVSWEPVFQHAPSTSIGDVTIAPSDQNIVWIGTGEANIFRSSMAGAGVYKSTDAGKSWKYMGLAGTHTIPRIVIHPQNPDIVYVAASGHEWTNNKERGVFKTTDGGQTWEKVLFINDQTGAIDLVMDPSDNQILYAATWQRIRKKWNDPRVGPDYNGSSIYKTTDGGKTWRQVVKGLPEAKYRGRIGIDLCRAKPNVIYAFIDNYKKYSELKNKTSDAYGRPSSGRIIGATVYRSDDGGGSWRQVSEIDDYTTRISGTYGWVFGQIRVDPINENKIYVMGLALNLSEDGGKTFKPLRGMHGDHHGLWIDPDNTDYLVNVNDGGLAISYDGGKNWRTFYNNIPLAQFFNVMYDMDEPFHIYGSIQDYGSRRGVVDLSRGRDRIPAVEFEGAPGGEGSSHAIDPTDPNVVYSAGFYGNITRTNLKTGERKNIVPKPPEGEPRYRGQWLAPFIISPHNPRIIYHGMNFLFRSLNRGDSWDRISPDLTYNDPGKMGDIPYQTIFTISESPLKFGLIYVGTDDGRAHVTKDGGLHWQEIVKGLPYRKWVSRIVASAYNEGTVYMSQNGKRDDDFAGYLWKSTDYGTTWQDITANLPCGPINVVREDPQNKNVLYVGTDLGVYVSINGGKKWYTLAGNFPTTFVHDLVIHPRDNIMVAATHGRGMWALDVEPIQQLNAEILAKDAHLFVIPPVTLRRSRFSRATGAGARISFFLKQAQKLKLEIFDEANQKVKTLNVNADAGYNTTTWDLTSTVKAAKKKTTGRGRPNYVKPGKYHLKCKVGKTTLAGEIVVQEK